MGLEGIRLQCGDLAEAIGCLVRLFVFQVGQAEVVEGLQVVRFQVDGPPVGADGFFRLALGIQRRTEAGMVGRFIGIKSNGFVQEADGVGGIPDIGGEDTHVMQGIRIFRFRVNHPLIKGFGFRQLPGPVPGKSGLKGFGCVGIAAQNLNPVNRLWPDPAFIWDRLPRWRQWFAQIWPYRFRTFPAGPRCIHQ